MRPYGPVTAIHPDAEQERDDAMSATHNRRDPRRHRLAGNDNETIVENTVDTEGHRLAGNDNETAVDGPAEPAPDDDEAVDDGRTELARRSN